ncbi:MAG: hypothetical protein WBF33_18605 [Candidatus Nitrosopolaris sp.]
MTERNDEKITTTTIITKTAKTDYPIKSILDQTCRKIKATINFGSS